MADFVISAGPHIHLPVRFRKPIGGKSHHFLAQFRRTSGGMPPIVVLSFSNISSGRMNECGRPPHPQS